MTRLRQFHPRIEVSGRGRRGRIAPIGGTTLLVLVTLVLATGPRDALPVRQSLAESRWAEPATSRETYETESRSTAPTKPSAPKFTGLGPKRPLASSGLEAVRVLSVVAAEESIAMGRYVRVALLNLPPPRV